MKIVSTMWAVRGSNATLTSPCEGKRVDLKTCINILTTVISTPFVHQHPKNPLLKDISLVAGQKPATSIFNSFSEMTREEKLLLEKNKFKCLENITIAFVKKYSVMTHLK